MIDVSISNIFQKNINICVEKDLSVLTNLQNLFHLRFSLIPGEIVVFTRNDKNLFSFKLFIETPFLLLILVLHLLLFELELYENLKNFLKDVYQLLKILKCKIQNLICIF